jgi:hypothetical protein
MRLKTAASYRGDVDHLRWAEETLGADHATINSR